jgi:tetratricopeptide (TPR) repeat protein
MPELLEKAIECERKAIALHPRSADAHTWLAMALGNLGRHEEAIQASREAVRLDPANPNGHFSLGRLLWIHMGMLEEGAKELERATALNPEAGYPYHQLALVLAILGRYDRAEAAARKAAELQERAMSGNEGLRVVGAHTRLGYVHYLRGRYDQAIEEYRRELDFLSSSDHLLRDRTRIELNAKLGAAHLRQGKRAEADRYFEQALRSHESRVARGMDDPFTRYYIACLHALRGNPEGALESLRVTLKALPLLTSRRARVDPDLESIRGLPEFALLVERR